MTPAELDTTAVAKLAAFVVLSALGAWISIQNWRIFWDGFVRKQRTASWTPALGAVLLAIGFGYAPWPELAALWWLPFLLDWGSLPGLAYTVLWHARRGDV